MIKPLLLMPQESSDHWTKVHSGIII